MAAGLVTFQTTPNPNAIKCVVEGVISNRPRSYFTAAEAAGDALGSALFAIPGVTNVLIQDTWLTVCKTPAADWKGIKAGVEKVVKGAVRKAE